MPGMAHTLLIVDDESDITDLLAHVLRREGFTVHTRSDGAGAMEVLTGDRVDLAVLDLMMPEMSGLEILKQIRAREATRGLPVILLTAKVDEVDRVLGFELGADDYVTKPFSPRELLLRIRALLKRANGTAATSSSAHVIGPIELDEARHSVHVEGRPVALTTTEFRLLANLVAAQGRVRTRQALLSQVWGYQDDVMSRTVDTHLRRLREKLGAGAAWIATVRGVGYRIQDPSNGA